MHRVPRGAKTALVTQLVRHLVVVQAKVVPDLVDDGVSHLLDHLFRRAAEPEDRATVDRDAGRQVPAGNHAESVTMLT